MSERLGLLPSARIHFRTLALMVELYQNWLLEEPTLPLRPSPEQWLEDWLDLADELMKDAPPGPTARELVEEGRNRLERR